VRPPDAILTGSTDCGHRLGVRLRKGISRGDAKELGELLDEGEAALVVIGESRLEKQLNKALQRAEKSIEKEIDANGEELKQELRRELDEVETGTAS
jgi:tRNA U54 and U55 pseudouridine synthase Pus10